MLAVIGQNFASSCSVKSIISVRMATFWPRTSARSSSTTREVHVARVGGGGLSGRLAPGLAACAASRRRALATIDRARDAGRQVSSGPCRAPSSDREHVRRFILQRPGFPT
jgi:hypothetical protein